MRFSESALIQGFALSAVVQAVVRNSTVLLGDDRPHTLAIAALSQYPGGLRARPPRLARS
ncbi:hypothetical protein [Streptomyces fagopyri]|uniref:hypothetical protein n=1 Tax=Streptomyces fagopyri TaxID=2662397 RepID=UPI0033F5DB99